MLRTFLAVAAALVLAACSRKDEQPVVAAPLSEEPPSPAGGSAPSLQPGAELPPDHPPLGGGVSPAEAGAPEAPPHGAAMSAGPDEGDVKVEKAEGKDARTVAEVFAQRASLKGKTVAVRGKVVKYNAGIMGKNWVHLRDGTGTAGKDNDVTVTTQDEVRRGEVVTFRGTVAIDQDIGMGGAPYPVIIEDAKVTR